MSARILRADALVPVPWRNGRRVTREIAVHPAGAGAENFLWRVSVAEVVGPAPFSRFPGVDRSILGSKNASFIREANDKLGRRLGHGDDRWTRYSNT